MRELVFFVLLFIVGNVYSQPPEPRPLNVYPEDDEHYNGRYSTFCDSCTRYYTPYKKNRYNLFLEHVYTPAMKNAAVSAGNKLLLEDIKSYLECDGSPDECGVDNDPIFAVYNFGLRKGGRYVSLFTDIPFYDEEYVRDDEDTVLHHGLMKKKMNIYYSNYKVSAPYSIKQHYMFSGTCEDHRIFILHQADSADFRKPAFCSPHKLELIYKSDRVMNRLLKKHVACKNGCGYCDGTDPQESFAQLKNVPFLYFTSDEANPEWENDVRYPSRGLYLKLSGSMVIKLWDYRVEFVECSCI